jgi:hypothetical protein
MQTNPYSRRRLTLIAILAILITVMIVAMLAGCSQPTDDIASVGQASTESELSAPETTSVSNSANFGDTNAAELSGGIELDAAVLALAGLLLFGSAYLVANAWWIGRALVLPPMKLEEAISDD